MLTHWGLIKFNQSPKEDLYPFTLFLKGQPITRSGASIPYVFMEFNSNDDIKGYYAYFGKTRGFNCFWKFKLTKYGESYISDSIPSCYEKLLTSPISLKNMKGKWILFFPDDKSKYELSVLPKNYKDVNRNYIYSLATFNELYNIQINRKNWNYELSAKKNNYFKFEEEPILNGNFNDLKKHVDSLDVHELANLLHIKNY